MKIEILRTLKVMVDGEAQLVLKGTIISDEVEPIHEEILLEVENPRTDFPTVKVLDPNPTFGSEEKGAPVGAPKSTPKKKSLPGKK